MTDKTFGQRLCYQRLKLKLTQEKLGSMCKQPKLANQICQWERGHGKPNPDNIVQLVEALGCHFKDLMLPAVKRRKPPALEVNEKRP